jgi:hypothetical protein
MTLKEYFESVNGTGVLSTADSTGKVDATIYSIPHIFDDETLAFVMRERLTHLNLFPYSGSDFTIDIWSFVL